MVTVVVSGGYDPVHVGHIENIRQAKLLGDRLIIILTRDDQLIAKKGYIFMPYEERKSILESIRWVDEVVENIDSGIECWESIKHYKPNILAKGGDRTEESMPETEKEACKKIGCQIIYGIGGRKVQSSSSLLKKYCDFLALKPGYETNNK